MRRELIIRAVAGLFVLTSVWLTLTVHPNWIYLAVFVGLNLLQSAFTGWCLLETILKRFRIGSSS